MNKQIKHKRPGLFLYIIAHTHDTLRNLSNPSDAVAAASASLHHLQHCMNDSAGVSGIGSVDLRHDPTWKHFCRYPPFFFLPRFLYLRKTRRNASMFSHTT